MHALEIQSVTKRYGDEAVVDDLTFTVAPGRVTGFLGPNGAGKSTTMKVLLDLAAADHWRATIGGVGIEAGELLYLPADDNATGSFDGIGAALVINFRSGTPEQRADRLEPCRVARQEVERDDVVLAEGLLQHVLRAQLDVRILEARLDAHHLGCVQQQIAQGVEARLETARAAVAIG